MTGDRFMSLLNGLINHWGEKFAEFIGQQEKEATLPVPVYPFLWDIVYKPIVVYCVYINFVSKFTFRSKP